MPRLPDALRTELAGTIERILSPDLDLRALAREMNEASGAIRTRAWIGAQRATIDQVMEIDRTLAPVTGHEPDLTLLTEREGSPVYMRRWWLRREETADERDQDGLYVHVFENDDPAGFHNHPWPSASLLLDGGPVFEQTPHGTTIIENRSIVLRPAAHRHRIRLRQGPTPNDGSVARIPAITLFATGRRVQEWGFEQPPTGPSGRRRPRRPADHPQSRN